MPEYFHVIIASVIADHVYVISLSALDSKVAVYPQSPVVLLSALEHRTWRCTVAQNLVPARVGVSVSLPVFPVLPLRPSPWFPDVGVT